MLRTDQLQEAGTRPSVLLTTIYLRSQHCAWCLVGTQQMFAECVNEITQEENPVLPRIQIYNPLIGYKLVLSSLQSGIIIHLFS